MAEGEKGMIVNYYIEVEDEKDKGRLDNLLGKSKYRFFDGSKFDDYCEDGMGFDDLVEELGDA